MAKKKQHKNLPAKVQSTELITVQQEKDDNPLNITAKLSFKN